MNREEGECFVPAVAVNEARRKTHPAMRDRPAQPLMAIDPRRGSNANLILWELVKEPIKNSGSFDF
ncbi:hypothetical protein [Haloferula sp. A504]|uniref:hypothetical protein n=1 Tax=Haloferula sp. A504 TaxID=3373601 RepID=UPI0031C5D0CF|nr:hypothetical protein [Verrucomicrobiaceae bacterium E54]